jgi:hypothetical protein
VTWERLHQVARVGLLAELSAAFEVNDIFNDQITSANSLGVVGLDWKLAGFGDFNGDGSTDMMLRNSTLAHSRSTTSATISSLRRPAASMASS